MNIIRPVFALLLSVSLMSSCAKPESTDYYEKEQDALDEWIRLNAPDAKPLTEGIYYEVLQAAPADASKVEPGVWVQMDYMLRELDSGNILFTRSQEIAKKLGTYSKYAHYVPDFCFVASTVKNNSIMNAQYYALLEMSEGEVWRIYSPSAQVFKSQGISNGTGYNGQYSLEKSRPVIIDDFTVVKVIKDPDEYERQQIRALALSPEAEGGWGLTESDTVTANFYRQFLKRNEKADTIMPDSAARIYYKAMFLDGKVFATNIDSVWHNHFGGRRYSSSYLKYVDDTTNLYLVRGNPTKISTDMPNKPFTILLQENKRDMLLRYGDSVRIVMTSIFAYEDTGRAAYKTASGTETGYNYNPDYYALGGYEYYGTGSYDEYKSTVYDYYYNNTSSNYYAQPEIRPFTPVIYEFVVKHRAGMRCGKCKE